jgi:flagellar basal-body rod protein FlgF
MENPSYISLSLMSGLRRQLDVMANNMANVSTPGFQGERITFRTMVSERARSGNIEGPGQKTAFVTDAETWRDTRPGPVERTGNPLDVALVGPGYFALETEDGVRYTRAGSFRPDAQGRLITANGAVVQGQGGAPITIPQGETSIEIDGNGTVVGKNGPIGKLRLVAFEDEQALKKTGGNLLETEAEPVAVDGRTRVAQGMIEGSNVQAVVEVTQMIELMRRYQSASRLLEQEHDRARRAIEKLARVA